MKPTRKVNPAEKPYEFVPFSGGSLQLEPAPGHQQFLPNRLSGRLALKLTAKRAVQIASGGQEVSKTKSGEEVVTPNVAIKRGGQPMYILPGSSLKGAIRSVVEALSLSCVRVTGWQSRGTIPPRLKACSRVDKLCPACRLFGMTGGRRDSYLGQVQLQDGLPQVENLVLVRTPLLWAPARSRRGLPGRYQAGRDAKGRKFYYHGITAKGPDTRLAAGPGSVFGVQVDFANLTAGEMGLLLTALGQHPQWPFLLKIGAAKPVGLGSVAVEVIEINLLGDIRQSGRAGASREQLKIDTNSQELKGRINKWIDAAEAGPQPLIHRPALEKIWQILQEKNLSRPSPEGLY